MVFNTWYKNLWPSNDYEDKVFVLSGKEGTAWEDMKINDETGQIRVYLKVVGFVDRGASFRSWGHTTLDKFVEKQKVVYKYKEKIVERVKPLQVIKTPQIGIEKLLSRFGFFRII